MSQEKVKNRTNEGENPHFEVQELVHLIKHIEIKR